MMCKSDYWKAIKNKCRDCRGDSRGDSVCQDMAGWGPCPLLPYRGNPKRRGPDGKMLPIYGIREIRRHLRQHCTFCMNRNPIYLCQDYTCPLNAIVIERRKQPKGDAIFRTSVRGGIKPLPDSDSPKTPLRDDTFSSNFAAPAIRAPTIPTEDNQNRARCIVP